MRKLWLVLCIGWSLHAVPAVVNHGPNTCYAVSGNISCAFQSAVTSGNTLVVTAGFRSTGTLPTTVTFTDTLSTSYSLSSSSVTTSNGAGAWIYCGIAGSSGANTVTISGMGTYFVGHVLIAEISGANGCTMDGSSGHNYANNNVPVTCGTTTTATANSLVLAVAYLGTSSSDLTIPSGYTSIQLQNTGGTYRSAGLASLLQATAGPTSPTWTGTAQINACAVAAFAAAGSSSTAAKRKVLM